MTNHDKITKDVITKGILHYNSISINDPNTIITFATLITYYDELIDKTQCNNLINFIIQLNDDSITKSIFQKQISLSNIQIFWDNYFLITYAYKMDTYQSTQMPLLQIFYNLNYINTLKFVFDEFLNYRFGYNINEIKSRLNVVNMLVNYFSTFSHTYNISNETIKYILNFDPDAVQNIYNCINYEKFLNNFSRHLYKFDDDVICKIMCHIKDKKKLNYMLGDLYRNNMKNNFDKLITLMNTSDIDLKIIFNNLYHKNMKSKYTYEQTIHLFNSYLDVLIEFNVPITKEFVIYCITQKHYIFNIKNYDIKIDDEIIKICCDNDYYPFLLDKAPNEDILIRECMRKVQVNMPPLIERLTYFKNIGAIFTQKCLESACNIYNNYLVIQFLINNCGLFVDKQCFELFQSSHSNQGLTIIIDSYCNNFLEKKTEYNSNVKLNENELLTIPKKDIVIDKTCEYKINSKILKLIKPNNVKKNTTYDEIYKLFLQYLIHNNLIIGNYFIINTSLEECLHINKSTLLHIDQLDNIISYVIKNVK